MKHNPVQSQLRSGQPSVGTWLSLANIFAARFLARAGFSWLTVDVEHSAVDWETACHMFAAIADAGSVPLARVPCGSHDHIKRALDAGAFGIVVPMVNTVAEAKAAIAACKYPPQGNRSVGGGVHALNFAATSCDYFAKANNEVLVVLQCEHVDAVENFDAIFSQPGVDAVFVGPNDLAASMRKADGTNPSTTEHEAMLSRILQAGKRCKVPVGLHCFSPEEAKARADAGWQFLAINSDLRFMIEGAAAALKPFKGVSTGTDKAY